MSEVFLIQEKRKWVHFF